ncbi:hypothetical protein CLOM_g18399, partial [Closterium sp. NIES-68]
MQCTQGAKPGSGVAYAQQATCAQAKPAAQKRGGAPAVEELQKSA